MPYARINPSGCEIRKDRIKLRLDFFLNPTEPNYEKHHLYVPDWDSPEAQAGYPGEVDAEGNPVDLNDYQAWVDSLPHIWVDTPFHVHMIHPFHTASDNEIKADITRCLGYFYAFKQHCWDSEVRFIDEWKKVAAQDGEVRHRFVAGKPKDKNKNNNRLQDILNRIEEFEVGIAQIPEGINLRIGEHGTIDVGDSAEDMDSANILYLAGSYTTRVTQYNPANASGTIDTVEVYIAVAQANNSIRFGTFEDNGSHSLTCRDAEEAGYCSLGYNEFTGLSIDVATDDYIGCDSPTNKNLSIDSETAIARAVYHASGKHCVIDDTDTYTEGTNYRYALVGTGTEGVAPTTLELRSATDTDARLALDTGVTLALRSATDTEARLALNVAILIAGRAYSNTRADITLDVLVSIELRSFTDTRADITLTVTEVTELELRSATDTRADLILDTGIALALRSASDTRAALTLDTAAALDLRSASDTRAAIALNTEIGLVLRSFTDTRAAITISVTAVTELYLRSATDTRAAITLDILITLALRSISDTRASLTLSALISLELRSISSTRAAIALTISLVTEIQCRSATATRVAIQLNSVITLALLSQTNTRAALLFTTAFRYQGLNMAIQDRQLTMAMRGNQE